MRKQPNKKKKVRKSEIFQFATLGAVFGLCLSGYLNDWSSGVSMSDCWCCPDDRGGFHYSGTWWRAALRYYYVEIAVCTAIGSLFAWRTKLGECLTTIRKIDWLW